ncbi:hypothetical protein V1505DRAFT_388012 [Lipomyces doorenjongii]
MLAFWWAAVTKVGLETLKQNIDVNVYGAYTAAIAFSPFVQRSSYRNRVFVLLGSSFGSITTAKENFDFHNEAFGTVGINNTAVYDISKTAEARLAIEFDLELRPQGVPFLLVHPGLTKTDMNAMGMISVDTSASGLVNVIGTYSAERKEKFLDYRGEELAWFLAFEGELDEDDDEDVEDFADVAADEEERSDVQSVFSGW